MKYYYKIVSGTGLSDKCVVPVVADTPEEAERMLCARYPQVTALGMTEQDWNHRKYSRIINGLPLEVVLDEIS